MFGLFRWRRGGGREPLEVRSIQQRGPERIHWETLVMLSCVSLRLESLEMTRSVEYEDMTTTDQVNPVRL